MLDLRGLDARQKVAALNEAIRDVAEKADAASSSEQFKAYLQAMSRFHDYSPGNSFLIQLQRPDATLVAGFRKWQEKFNRRVRKGAHGIAILVPYTYGAKVDDEDDDENGSRAARKLYFRVGYVFDVSDTEGDPIPELSHRPEGAEDHGMFADLEDFARLQGVRVDQEIIPGLTRGYSVPGGVCIDPSYGLAAQACTLAHELAHEYMHQRHGEAVPREVKEIEAETAAAVVAFSYGLEPPSENYLASWSNGREAGVKVMERMERIRAAASWIIDGIESVKKQAEAEPVGTTA